MRLECSWHLQLIGFRFYSGIFHNFISKCWNMSRILLKSAKRKTHVARGVVRTIVGGLFAKSKVMHSPKKRAATKKSTKRYRAKTV